jgi:hypothetical protein
MKTRHAFTFATAILAGSIGAFAEEKGVPKDERPVVQLAILLDNSGSMNGLITQAKSQLWSIVNEFITAKQDGKAPRVQVALFEYGVSDLGKDAGYIRKLSDLTDDLDKLSEQLFSISTRTSGSEEYCGMVINEAVEKLGWDKSSKTYKAVFIAGNEPFTQGPVEYQSACKAAITKGIIVNTIHCGSDADGVNGKWKDGAALADGKYLLIDHNATVAAVSAPQDKEIAELNGKLNSTYVAYGAMGGAGRARQVAQDANAASAPAAPAVVTARALSKASAVYSNSGWDLVDRAKEKDFDITKLKDEELSEELRKMTPEERKDYVAKKTAERAEIQKRIGTLAKERDAYVTTKMKETKSDTTLGKAVTGAVREQAAKKGVRFE